MAATIGLALVRLAQQAPAAAGLLRLLACLAPERVGRAGAWRRAAEAVIEAAVPADTQSPSSWGTCAALLPHARAVLALTSVGLWRMARYLGESGGYSAARDLFGRIAEAHERAVAFGPEHRDTLAAWHALASFTGEAGDAAGARDLFAALVPVVERVLGPEHPGTQKARRLLAYWSRG